MNYLAAAANAILLLGLVIATASVVARACQREYRETLPARIKTALASMMDVEEIGSALPIPQRSYAVKLNTGENSIELIRYDNTHGDDPSAAKECAESARRLFINGIAERLFARMTQKEKK